MAAKESNDRTKNMKWFERWVKTRLPTGVGIVDVFWHVEEGPKREWNHSVASVTTHLNGPVVRIDLGGCVQLDLWRLTEDSYYVTGGGSDSNPEYRQPCIVYILRIYPASDNYRDVPLLHESGKDEPMDEVLYDALARLRANRLSG